MLALITVSVVRFALAGRRQAHGVEGVSPSAPALAVRAKAAMLVRMTFTISNLIALLVVAIALLAALHARWTWAEARKTNLLALHANRLEVFRAFNSLRQAVQEQGAGVEEQRVAMFHNPCEEAKFYFSEAKTSQLLSQYFDTCWALARIARKPNAPPLTEAEQREQDRLLAQEESLHTATKMQLETELCRAVRRPWWRP